MKKAQDGMMLTEIGLEDSEPTPNLDSELKHELMKDLEPDVLARIKKGFDLYKGSVKLPQFIAIMVDVLFEQHAWRKYSR